MIVADLYYDMKLPKWPLSILQSSVELMLQPSGGNSDISTWSAGTPASNNSLDFCT
jgi:hypothetical protein